MKRILYYGDSPVGESGFAQVAKHVLKGLHETGKYKIDIANRGYMVGTYDTEKYPYTIFNTPENDRYGLGTFWNALKRGSYDVLLVMNDPSTITKEILEEIKKQQQTNGLKYVLYTLSDVDYPLKGHKELLTVPDVLIAYSELAKNCFQAVAPERTDIPVIYHGCEQDITPTRTKQAKELREDILAKYIKAKRTTSDKAFLFLSINRNIGRKDIGGLMHAFLIARHQMSDAYLYIHSALLDSGGYLPGQLAGLIDFCKWYYPKHGLDWKLELQDAGIILSPMQHFEQAIPKDILNDMYPASDAFVTATTGEGWGLTTTEAMRAALPVIIPDNTTAKEIIGDNQRGYLVKSGNTPSQWHIGYGWSDMLRPSIDIEDMAEKLVHVYSHRTEAKEKGKLAYKWTEQNLWQDKVKQFIDIFNSL